MADWTEPLPDEAVEGETTHIEDHNKIVNALVEVRVNIDGIELTPGPEGPAGADGADGLPGADGAQGIQGEPGAKGDKGDKGDPGTPGTDGQDGADGAQGIQGVKGDKGDKGDPGEPGADGADVDPEVLASKVTGIGLKAIWTGTQAQYDAITTPDGETLYLVAEEA